VGCIVDVGRLMIDCRRRKLFISLLILSPLWVRVTGCESELVHRIVMKMRNAIPWFHGYTCRTGSVVGGLSDGTSELGVTQLRCACIYIYIYIYIPDVYGPASIVGNDHG